MRVKNKANRGKEGVHAQGNRNHYLHKAVNEEKLKRPLSHMQAWEIAHTRKDPKPGEPKYYGKKTAHRKKAYSDGYLALHPDTPDPIAADLDERVVVGMGPKEHGREAVLDAVITPSISYTQLRRIDPTLSQRTCTRMSSAPSLSLFQEQQTAYMEYTRQETMAWHDRLHAYHQQRDREMQHAFQEMATGRCPQWPSAEGPPAQPVLLTFEEFVAQNAGPSPAALTLMSPFQKGESSGLAVTCDNVLD
nr:uncharacterized protein LOC120968579 [Aegilops tauschii subsp. strangulata]